MFLADIAEVGRIVGAISRDVSFLVEGCFLLYVHNRGKLVYSTPREPLGHILGMIAALQNVSQQKQKSIRGNHRKSCGLFCKRRSRFRCNRSDGHEPISADGFPGMDFRTKSCFCSKISDSFPSVRINPRVVRVNPSIVRVNPSKARRIHVRF